MPEVQGQQLESVGELASKLRKADVRDERGLLKPPVYEVITHLVPIVCVDLIPATITPEGPRIGVIERATGSQAGKLAILGGSVKKNEPLVEAVHRHLLESLGEDEFAFHEGNDVDRPFYVAQYAHRESSVGLFDPTKHSIGLTYLININDPKVTRDEASAFHWIGEAQIPEVTAYNQGQIMTRAIDFLRKLPLVPEPKFT